MRIDLRNGLVIALHAVLVSIGTIRHEMWRDEHQAWLVARDAASLDQVVRNLAYDGHPALWHSLLFVLTRVTHDPFAMQVLHALLAIMVGALLVLFAPFPRKIRYLLPFGYLFLFEYGVVSRSYALSALLVFAYCAWSVRGRSGHRRARLRSEPDTPGVGRRMTARESSGRPVAVRGLAGFGRAIPWTMLALLANTNAFGMLTAISLAAGKGIDTARAGMRNRRGGSSATSPFDRAEVAGVVVFVAAVAFSVSCILPDQGSTFPVVKPDGLLDVTRLQSVFAHIGGAFAYLPKLQTHFWNTYLVPPAVRILLGIAVIAGAAFALKKHEAPLASFLTGSLLLAAAQYWTGLGWIRYTGFHVILLIACAWLAHADRPGAAERSSAPHGDDARRVSPPAQGGRRSRGKYARVFSSQPLMTVALLLAAVYAASGLFAWALDVRLPFSTSARAAEFLRNASGSDSVRDPAASMRPIVGATDFILSPLSSHLDRRIFYIERAEYGSFVIWDARRKPEYTFEDLRGAVQEAMNEDPSDEGFLVLSVQPRYRQDGVVKPLEATMLDQNLRIDLVHSVPPGIVEDEQYFIYAVRRGPDGK